MDQLSEKVEIENIPTGEYIAIPPNLIKDQVIIGPKTRADITEAERIRLIEKGLDPSSDGFNDTLQRAVDLKSHLLVTPALMLMRDIEVNNNVTRYKIDIADVAVNETLPTEHNPLLYLKLLKEQRRNTDGILKDDGIIRDRTYHTQVLLNMAMDERSLNIWQSIRDSNPNKKTLIISGHGGGGQSEQTIGEKHGSTIKLNEFIDGLGNLINCDIAATYSNIVIVNCNPFGIPIDQDIIDRLGVPIIYNMGYATADSEVRDKGGTEIGYPRNFSRSELQSPQ